MLYIPSFEVLCSGGTHTLGENVNGNIIISFSLPAILTARKKEYKKAHKEDDGGFLGRNKDAFKLSALTSVTGLVGAAATFAAGELMFQGTKYARKAVLEAENVTRAQVMQISGCRDEQVLSPLCRV